MSAIRRKRKPRKPGWYIIAAVLLTVGLYFTFSTGRRVVNIVVLLRMKSREERQLEEALKMTETLRLERERLLNDLTYIEEIARKKYGMVRDGEELLHVTLPDSVTTGEE